VIYILTPMKMKTHPPQIVMLQIMAKATTRTTLNIKYQHYQKIAQKVAKFEKTQLDEKQYIAYEMVACTFLLGLVNDGRDKNTKLGAYLQKTMEITSTADANDILKS
jgi:hypothetical protein